MRNQKMACIKSRRIMNEIRPCQNVRPLISRRVARSPFSITNCKIIASTTKLLLNVSFVFKISFLFHAVSTEYHHICSQERRRKKSKATVWFMNLSAKMKKVLFLPVSSSIAEVLALKIIKKFAKRRG